MPAATTPTASIGFEARLWEAADLLRNNVDPAEYKHVVLGLLFLKYISDAFEARAAELGRLVATPGSDYHVAGQAAQAAELATLLEDPDEFVSVGAFWVPPGARWAELRAVARTPEIGKHLDDAMDAIERANPRLRGALPKIYARPSLDKAVLGKLVDVIAGIGLVERDEQGRSKDILGRVYEYFLARFASAEGKGGGEFYTPESVVKLLVALIEPYGGRVYDPCCGSGGMFVQSVKFIEEHGGQRRQASIYGQESNPTTWRLARMNLAIRGIEANLGQSHADTFREDLFKGDQFDFILANPPFNVSQWHGEELRQDVRWKPPMTAPPVGNANYAWILHMVHHLTPNGVAAFILANGSMSSMQSGEGQIRQKLVEMEGGLVDCMVALPPQLFYSTQIPVCLWVMARNRNNGRSWDRKTLRDRRGEVLFIDARKLGTMDTRVHRLLEDGDIQRIADTYHRWRTVDGGYRDVAGFCKSAGREEIAKHEFVLTPGRYVGAEEVEEEGESFEGRMGALVSALKGQMAEASRLDKLISEVVREMGNDT